jgi:hypothetical protein
LSRVPRDSAVVCGALFVFLLLAMLLLNPLIDLHFEEYTEFPALIRG